MNKKVNSSFRDSYFCFQTCKSY